MMQSFFNTVDRQKTAIANSRLLSVSDIEDKYSDHQSDSSHSRFFSQSGESNPIESGDEEVTSITGSEEEDEKYLNLNKNESLTLMMKTGESIKYRYDTKLARGAYGQVVNYVLTSDKVSSKYPKNLCVKIGLRLGDLDADVEILDKLSKTKQIEGLIETCMINGNWKVNGEQIEVRQPVLLMPRMDGTIKDLLKELVFPKIIDKYWLVTGILHSVCHTFQELIKLNIYYTDIKIANCLYTLSKQSKGDMGLTITLGDIGSAFLGGRKAALATYPSTYRKRCHHFVPNVFDLQYGLMVLFFEMMTVTNIENEEMELDRDLFLHLYHQNIKTSSLDERVLIIKSLFNNLLDLPGTNTLIKKMVDSIKNKLYFGIDPGQKRDPVVVMQSLVEFFKMCHEYLALHSKLAKMIKFQESNLNSKSVNSFK